MNYFRRHAALCMLLKCFISTWALMKVSGLGTGNVFTLLLFLMLFVYYKVVEKSVSEAPFLNVKKTYIAASVLALIFTFFYMIISAGQFVADLSNSLFKLIILIVVFAGMLLFFYQTLLYLFSYLICKAYINTILEKHADVFPFYRKHVFLITTLLCFLCWLPMFLYLFPGILTPDSLNQVKQVLGWTSYSNHHPWIHTLLIKLFYSIGSLFTSDLTVAISFYTVGQMILFAMSIAYFLSTCVHFGVNTYICLGITAFYTLVPYHAVYAVTIWKDILFAATILCFTCSLFRITHRFTRLHCSIYFISCLLFCLLRSNGWYAFIVSFPFLIFHFRKEWKRYALLHILALVLVLIIKIPIVNAFHVSQPDFVESLHIPIQQIANVLVHDRELSHEQLTLIDTVVSDHEKIKEVYVPTFADNVKDLIRAGNQGYLVANKGAYFKLWFQLLCKYPRDYIEAYVNQTYGYYYPDIFYTIADNEGISQTDLNITARPIIHGPLVVKYKEIILKFYQIIPLYGLIWGMGFMAWLLLFLCASSIAREENHKLIYYIPCIALILTVLIATPVAADFRYVYFLFVNMPLYIYIALRKE